MKLIVNEIFYSIQGESIRAGFTSIFIRLTGCNLKCKYCDTEYAKKEGQEKSIDEIIETIKTLGEFDHITITGGEPLIQKDINNLIKELLGMKYKVQIETNGSIDLSKLPGKTRKIVDVKTPSSGESSSFLLSNLRYINDNDELKFVISDINDYNFSKDIIKKEIKDHSYIINFSPVSDLMSPGILAEQIIVDRLPVRLNLQQHKVIWPHGEPK